MRHRDRVAVRVVAIGFGAVDAVADRCCGQAVALPAGLERDCSRVVVADRVQLPPLGHVADGLEVAGGVVLVALDVVAQRLEVVRSPASPANG